MSVSSVPRVVGYVRSATTDQRGYSLGRQRERLAEPWQSFSNSEVIPPATRFYEDDGVSGLSRWQTRPGLRQLIQDAGTDEVDVVRVVSLDRLSRSRVDQVDIMDALEELGVQLRADDCEQQTPFGLPMVKMMALAGREERQFLAEQAAEQEGQ
jgi:DNA invertase Pin-like site-specific DNA recombinase